MASNLFAGNPPPNVVRWIEDNVKSAGSWDFNLSSIQSTGRILNVPGSLPVYCMRFGGDDNTLIISGYDGTFRKYIMQNGDLSTAQLAETTSATNIAHFVFSDDGKTLVGVSKSANWFNVTSWAGIIDRAYVTMPIHLTVPYDISQIPVIDASMLVNSYTAASICGIYNNGTRILIKTSDGELMNADVSTPYDFSTRVSSFNIVTNNNLVEGSGQIVTGVAISPDGKTMLVQQASNGKINKTTLNEPFVFDLANMTCKTEQVNTFGWGSNILINSDATKLYICNGSSNNGIVEYDISK